MSGVKRTRSERPVPGEQHGYLTVVEELPPQFYRTSRRKFWKCRCLCGTERAIREEALRTGQAKSCGCRQYERRVDDLVGQRFGNCVVIGFDESSLKAKSGHRWFVRCDCGEIRSRNKPALRSRRTCGCVNYGEDLPNRTKHPLYAMWKGMHERCTNSRHHHYDDYGGRGIRVCERWNLFKNFVNDVGPRPPGNSRGRSLWSIDRIDVNGNYEPGNVRWATQEEQCANKRLSGARVEQVLKDAEDNGHSIAWIRERLLGAGAR